MNPRNVPHSNDWMTGFEVAQQMQNQHYPEPYILLGNPPNFPQSNIHQILPPPGRVTNFNLNHLPEHHDGTTFYRTPQYAHQGHPPTNLELGIRTPSNSYYPCLNPAVGRMFSVPLNHGSMDQLPSSTNVGGSSAHLDDYGMNSFAPDGFGGLSKRNAAEGSMGNIHYINASAAPSSSMPPLNACHFDGGFAIADVCFPLPEYRGNYSGQSFQPPASTRCDRQPNGAGDGSTLSFDLSPMSPYFEVSSVTTSSSEIGNVGGQRFDGGASTSRGSANFLHSSPMHHVLYDFHHLQNVQEASRYNLNFHLPAVATSRRHPINNAMHHGSMSNTQQRPELVPAPPGIRIYRSHRRRAMPEGMDRHHDLPHLRLHPEEGLAILEFPGHYEVGPDSALDLHRDMRLDIDYMSYEELLALSERIGNVNTGLSDEAINFNLKTRVHRSCMTTIDLEELPACSNEIDDSCVICQDEYEDGDNIGTLDCGHEYHVDCLKKWLSVKNACPICKSTALDIEHKDW